MQLLKPFVSALLCFCGVSILTLTSALIRMKRKKQNLATWQT